MGKSGHGDAVVKGARTEKVGMEMWVVKGAGVEKVGIGVCGY